MGECERLSEVQRGREDKASWSPARQAGSQAGSQAAIRRWDYCN